MRKIWITGGRGFVGRALTEELRGRGHEVWVLDREGAPDEGSHELALDLVETESVAESARALQPDAIVHLAAQSSGSLSFSIPLETIRNNVESTLGLLEAVRSLPAELRPRIVSAGTCEEYGVPAGDHELPLREDQLLRPSSPYAVSKAAQTLLCQQYRRSYGIEVLAVRCFTTTGPGQRDLYVFSSWARQIAELEREGGGTLLVGNLEVSRDVADVRDVARAYADLVEVEWEHDVVNLCTGKELAIRRALELLLSGARVRIEVAQDPARLRPSDVPRFVGDASRLRSMIGWIPSTPIEDTLRDLLDGWRAEVESTPDDAGRPRA